MNFYIAFRENSREILRKTETKKKLRYYFRRKVLRTGDGTTKISVSDPDSFIPDPHPVPDPAFQAEYQSGSKVSMSKNRKNVQRKKNMIPFEQ